MVIVSNHNTLLILLLLSLLIITHSDLPPGPKPFCASKSIPKQLPITIDEIFSVDLSNYFVGYNLEYTQLSPKNFAVVKSNFIDQAHTPIDVSKIITTKISSNKN